MSKTNINPKDRFFRFWELYLDSENDQFLSKMSHILLHTILWVHPDQRYMYTQSRKCDTIAKRSCIKLNVPVS